MFLPMSVDCVAIIPVFVVIPLLLARWSCVAAYADDVVNPSLSEEVRNIIKWACDSSFLGPTDKDFTLSNILIDVHLSD